METLRLRLDETVVVDTWSCPAVIEGAPDWPVPASYLGLYLHVKPLFMHRLQTGREREQRLFVRRHSSQDPTFRFSTPEAR